MKCLDYVFIGGALVTAAYAWVVYCFLTAWVIPLGRAVHPQMEVEFNRDLGRKIAIYTHALTASVALAIGPFQVIPSFRKTHMFGHRRCGRIYMLCGFLGSISGIICGLHAQGGIAGKIGFVTLGCCWFASNLGGLLAVTAWKSIQVHERLMQISCALAYSAVSLRIMLPVAIVTDFEPVYGAVAWLCWTVNLVILELLRKFLRDTGSTETYEAAPVKA
eukprot:Skav233402  [mRNA]  locus=scaffold892:19874:25736:- [translate_table: standard]